MSRSQFSIGLLVFIILLTAVYWDCKHRVQTRERNHLVEQGRIVYQTEGCTSCHNSNPALQGSIGPAIAHSSLELLKAKVLRGEYPKGYKPKRTSEIMPKFEELEGIIPELHLYLDQEEF